MKMSIRAAVGAILMGGGVVAAVTACLSRQWTAQMASPGTWKVIAVAVAATILGAAVLAPAGERVRRTLLVGVGAIGSFVLVLTGVAGAQLAAEDDLLTRVPHGWAVSEGTFTEGPSRPGLPSMSEVRARVEQVVPGAKTLFTGSLNRPGRMTKPGGQTAVFPRGCSPGGASNRGRCRGPNEARSVTIVMPQDAATLFGAGPQGVAALERGEFVVGPGLPKPPRSATVVQVQVVDVPETDRNAIRYRRTWVREERRLDVAVTVDPALHVLRDSQPFRQTLMSPAGVQRFGGFIRWTQMVIVPPAGEGITREQAERLGTALSELGIKDFAAEVETPQAPVTWFAAGTALLCLLVAAPAAWIGRARRQADARRRPVMAAGLAFVGLAVGTTTAAAGVLGPWSRPPASAGAVALTFLPWLVTIVLVPCLVAGLVARPPRHATSPRPAQAPR